MMTSTKAFRFALENGTIAVPMPNRKRHPSAYRKVLREYTNMRQRSEDFKRVTLRQAQLVHDDVLTFWLICHVKDADK